MTTGLSRKVGEIIIAAFVVQCAFIAIAASQTQSAPEIKIEDIKFAGVVEPARRLAISNEINGVIRKIHFSGGEDISAGQLLFELNDTEFSIAVGSAKARLEQARARLEQATVVAARQQKLFSRGVATEARNIDTTLAAAIARAALSEAEAAVELAKLNLSRTQILAPISGRIGRPLVSEGAFVEAEAKERPLAEIVQVDPIFVAYAVPYKVRLQALRRTNAKNLKALLKQIRVRLILPTGEHYPQQGTPQLTTFQIDDNTGELTTWAMFANPQGLLIPGLKVQVTSSFDGPPLEDGARQ